MNRREIEHELEKLRAQRDEAEKLAEHYSQLSNSLYALIRCLERDMQTLMTAKPEPRKKR